MYEPKYFINQAVLKYVGSIEAAREVVENAALVPAWEAQFREDALKRTVHHGTHLEGNELSKEQAERVIMVAETKVEAAAEKAGIIGREQDIQEVLNYRKVMEWIDHLGITQRESLVVDESVLKELHKIVTDRVLPDDQRGNYRAVQVVIKNSKTGEVSYRPPPAIEVPYQLEEFFVWLNSDLGRSHHSVLRAGITHYELVRIHPFTDGNGRTARALALLLLYLEGYDVKRFFSLEQYFDENAIDYYNALQSVSNSEELDLTQWLEYFTRGLAFELDRVKQQVLKLSRDIQLKAKIGHQVALSDRQIKILETIQNSGGEIVSGHLEEILPMVSVDTILRDLKDLINKGLLKKRGRTKGAFYELTNR